MEERDRVYQRKWVRRGKLSDARLAKGSGRLEPAEPQQQQLGLIIIIAQLRRISHSNAFPFDRTPYIRSGTLLFGQQDG